ncbi:MAG: hypothetical protein ACXVZX_05130 [Terriglobales bacterium]
MKLVTKYAAALAVGLAVTVLAVYVQVTAPRRHFERFLGAVRDVRVGNTRLDEFKQQLIRSRIASFNSPCHGDRYYVVLTAQNSLLHKMHLAPLTTTIAQVQFQDSVASEISIIVEIDDLEVNGTQTPGTGATVRQGLDPKSCSQNLKSFVTQKGPYHWVLVDMDSCIAPQARAAALAINKSCLTKLRGCRTGEEIAPKVFGTL